MPYIITEESLPGLKDKLQDKFILNHEKRGPLVDISIKPHNRLLLQFACDSIYTEDNSITPLDDDIAEVLFLLGKKVTAVKPDCSNEDWDAVGVDDDMNYHVGVQSEVKKIDFVEGVLAVLLENDYWYPVSALEDSDTSDNCRYAINKFYMPIPSEGWITECYKVADTIFVKTMMGNWFAHSSNNIFFYTDIVPEWLRADSYVVLLHDCSKKNDSWLYSMPKNHVYKLREDANRFNFMICADINGSTTNGWYILNPAISSGYLKLRPAYPKEIAAYNAKNCPVSVVDYIETFTENTDVIEEKVVEIKTKRISSKNYL
jgi:hypothetical protein